MNKKRSEWANEEGSALVLTLMIFLVLTVLATSISFLTVGSFRLSDINRDGTSAFYIAEAGAKKAYEKASQEVMKTYEATTTTTSSDFYAALDAALDALFLNKELTFDKQFGDDAKANVTFTATDSNPRKYTLTSTGSVGGKTRTVQKQFDVSWVDKGGSGGFPALPSKKTVLVAKTSMILNSDVIGDIHSLSEKDDSIKLEWVVNLKKSTIFYPKGTKTEIKKEDIFDYNKDFEIQGHMPTLKQIDPQIDWSEYDDLLNRIEIPKNNLKVIEDIDVSGGLSSYTWKIESKEVYIKQLVGKEYIPITIDATHNDTVIFVDELKLTSTKSLEIKGNKKITLIVNNVLDITGSEFINREGKSDNLTLIYLGTNNISFNQSGSPVINANIFVKQVDISVNNTQINGVLLTSGGKVELSGADSKSKLLLIAPKAYVELIGSYSIQGSVIANTFKMSGGAQLTYPEPELAPPSFPGISGGPATTPTLEDLLKSGPILEQ